MEAIYNSMLGMVQASAERQTSSVASTQSDSTQNSEFRKMLERKQPEQNGANTEEGTDVTAEKTADPSNAEDANVAQAEADFELQRMVWAAMAAAPQTAVPTEQIAAAEEPVENLELASVPVAADVQPDAVREVPQDRMTVDDGAVRTGEPANQQIPVEESAQAEAKSPEAPGKDGLSAKAVDVTERDSRTADRPDQSGEAEQRVDYSAETPVFREVRTIPVKVGETAGTERTGEAQSVQDQLSARLTQALHSGETRVELQLEPENLGRVRVEMTWDKEGALHVSLYAESSHTRGLLERDLTGLQSLLSRNTQQEVHVEVPRQQESQQQNFYDGRNGREQDGQQQHEQQGRQQNRQQSGEEFLQQLRLGLIRLDGEAS